MPESDAQEPNSAAILSGAPATPTASAQGSARQSAADTPLPQSNTRAAQLPDEPGIVSEPGDTLLSAGKPADRLELLLEDRLGGIDDHFTHVEQELRQLDARLAVLEQKKSIAAPAPRQNPWLWIAFLVALIVVFQLLHALK
jgi:hypothetical protein